MTAALRTSLPFSAWPKTDQALWQAAHEKGGIFERDGAAAHWAEATAIQVAKGYGKWLWALQRFGSLDAKIAPAARVTEDLENGNAKVSHGSGVIISLRAT